MGRKNVFLIGLPGSGKSTLYRMLRDHLLSSGIDVTKHDDVKELYSMYLDEKKTRLVHFSQVDGSFAVTDSKAYDYALMRVNQKILENDFNGRRFVEFSRTDYDKAFDLFSRIIICDSVLIEVLCRFSICCKRNNLRQNISKADVDQHVVPDAVMQRYARCRESNVDYLKQRFPFAEVFTVDNSGSAQELEIEAVKIFAAIKE